MNPFERPAAARESNEDMEAIENARAELAAAIGLGSESSWEAIKIAFDKKDINPEFEEAKANVDPASVTIMEKMAAQEAEERKEVA